jgi:hypothetical protein
MWKSAKKQIPTFPSGFSLWELEYHECLKFLGQGFKNQLFQIEPSIVYWKGFSKVNIENEFTFFIWRFDTQVMVGKIIWIKMAICLLLIKPQRNMVEWPYIKYNIKMVFSKARILFFENFSIEDKMWELWTSKVLGKIMRLTTWQNWFFFHFNVIPIINHKLY